MKHRLRHCNQRQLFRNVNHVYAVWNTCIPCYSCGDVKSSHEAASCLFSVISLTLQYHIFLVPRMFGVNDRFVLPADPAQRHSFITLICWPKKAYRNDVITPSCYEMIDWGEIFSFRVLIYLRLNRDESP